MKSSAIVFACACALGIAGAWAADDPLTRPIQTSAAQQWNQPQPPVRLYANTYYVGVAGLSSVLVHTSRGLILLDGDLPQSVPLIEANIARLGFRVKDIRFILNSHAHFDHAGGIAALARDSGAVVLASPSSAAALRAGHAMPDDPQAAYADPDRAEPALYPAVTTPIREIRDGETLELGDARLVAHFTPGHTPGGTTWTWRECVEGRCLDIVYADSLNAISAPGFHFLADAQHGDLTAAFRRSIETVAALPCDILISAHPEQSGLPEKFHRLDAAGAVNPFVDPGACHRYADAAETLLDSRIEQERATTH